MRSLAISLLFGVVGYSLAQSPTPVDQNVVLQVSIANFGHGDIGQASRGSFVGSKTEFERFDNAMRQVLSVSKEELLKREAQYQKARERKRRPKK